MRRILVSGVFLSCAGVSLVLAAGSQRPARDRTLEATVTIDASRPASYKIPRSIFGTFLEPIGNSIYGGLWAQILQNPSLEANLWEAKQIADMVKNRPELARASGMALPLPWEPLDYAQGSRYAPEWDHPANSHQSLLLMALPDEQTGIRQEVYLPLRSTAKYVGSLYLKTLEGPKEVEVSIHKRNEKSEVLAAQVIHPSGSHRGRYEFELSVPRKQFITLEPAYSV